MKSYEPRREKNGFCICEHKDADQLRGNREADQRLCFRYIDIVQSLFFLNPKFQASSHLLWLYSPVCVRPGRKPRRPVFSRHGSYLDSLSLAFNNRTLKFFKKNQQHIFRTLSFSFLIGQCETGLCTIVQAMLIAKLLLKYEKIRNMQKSLYWPLTWQVWQYD